MLRIYIGFQAIKFHCFLPAPPPPLPPDFYCFPATTTTTTNTFLLFSFHHHHHYRHHHISIVFPPPSPPPPPHFHCFLPQPPPPPHFYCFPPPPQPPRFHCFPPRDSIKDYQLPFLVHFVAMSRVVNNNHGFLQLLADCPAYQRQFLLKTATPQQLHALVQQYSYGTHSHPRRK